MQMNRPPYWMAVSVTFRTGHLMLKGQSNILWTYDEVNKRICAVLDDHNECPEVGICHGVLNVSEQDADEFVTKNTPEVEADPVSHTYVVNGNKMERLSVN